VSGAPDRKVVEAQIGRPQRADSKVVSRCHLGLPVVVRVPPLLDDGTPFPTLYWLTCPLAATRIGRLESAGGVRRMESKAEADPDFAEALGDAHESYRLERDAEAGDGPGPLPSGGVAGSAVGVKCLHAHYAHTRAGGDNPVGALVEVWVEPLDCVEVCVAGDRLSPKWVGLA